MAVLRRIIHHALYYILLGPIIGGLVPCIVILIAVGELPILKIPFFIPAAIIWGWLPALITGVLIACLPAKTWLDRTSRCAISCGIGSIISFICYGVITMFIIHKNKTDPFLPDVFLIQILWICIGAGFVAGLGMGRLIEHLPGLGNARPKIDSLS